MTDSRATASRTELLSLTIRDLRNFEGVSLSPGPRFNIISGFNGMGKTNLLEAVYLLGALRSFRTTTRADLVREGCERARVSGVFGGAAAGLECEVELSASSKKVRVGGKALGAYGGHFRNLPMVLFHPATMALAQGGPETRRRFLDRALFQADAPYPGRHRSYLTALASRNRLLKQRPVDRRVLEPYDVQLAEHGAVLVERRARFVTRISPLFEEAFGQISRGLRGAVSYEPKVAGEADALRTALADRFPVDEARGHTTVGPHKDDLALSVDGRPARRFASQGQQRMVVLALKIAETRALAAATERTPLLLLDDISSELDRERNTELFEFLSGAGGQVFITTTHLENIRIETDRRDFQVTDGRVGEIDR